MNFGYWLQEKIKQHGISQKELAGMSGVSQSTISRWLRGLRQPEPTNLSKILPILNVSEQEGFLAAGFIKSQTLLTNEKEDSISIPFLSPKIPCGEPVELLDEYIMDYRSISKSMLECIMGTVISTEDVFMVRAIGDSMTGRGIYPDDWVLFSPSLNTQSGDIAIVFIDEIGLCMKEVLFQKDLLILKSANPSYNPIVITDQQSVRILGKVLMKMGKV
ncbi:MAG: helix-turn-helix domain-containing protein [Caldisericia bacterium]|nr:helix-turn-helix domain-containing protein [Caldisericia bacterium]